MSVLLFNLLKQNSTYLVISCLIFPLSLQVSLVFFTIFIVTRVLFTGNLQEKKPKNKLDYSIEIAFSSIFAIAIFDFYYESRIHFYPVSHYDYLMVAIVALILKLYPLKQFEFQRFCLILSLSPIVIFISHFTTFNFKIRNNWGFDNANGLGLYCAICLPLISCQLLSDLQDIRIYPQQFLQSKKIVFWLDIISLLFCSVMLVSSGSRSSFYTSLVVESIILLVYLKSNYNSYLKWRDVYFIDKNTFLYTFSCLGLMGILYHFILSKFIFIRRFINLTNSTNIYRTYVYKCYWNLGLEKPWWGWGIDKTSALCEAELKARYGGVNHAHNFILQIFADRGAIATLLGLMAIAYFMVIPSFKFIVNYNYRLSSTLYLGICASCLSILIVSLFQSSFYHYPLFPLWLGLFTGTLNCCHKLTTNN